MLRHFLNLLLVLGFALKAHADSVAQSSVGLEVDSEDPNVTKVVLLAGSPSNKAGQHEYFAGCALMMQWLRQTPGVFPTMAKDGWPKNDKIFQGARAVVCFMDGGGKQPFLAPDRWPVFRKIAESGAGLVMIHQAVDYVSGEHDQELLDWMGGVWLKDIGCRGHWDMELTLDTPSHPVLQGLTRFAVKGDGWLYNLHFKEGVIPLLSGEVPDKTRTTTDAKKHTGRKEIMAWAYERPDGGRSFAFTGCDLHQNWALPAQRKFVLNGILWSAKLPVPRAGAETTLDPTDLKKNLDAK